MIGGMRTLILALVHAYASGDLSLRDFQDWFIPATWDTRKFRDPDAVRVVRRVQLALAEFSSGDRTEPELKAELAVIAASLTPSMGLYLNPARQFTTGSSAVPVPVEAA
jgi:hypothetical protein